MLDLDGLQNRGLEMSELLERLREPTVSDVAAGLDKHEAVCAERWGQILERMSRMETVIYSAAAALLTGMGVVVWTLLQRVAHL
jgi:hypothetical protein